MTGHGQNMPLKERHEEGLEREQRPSSEGIRLLSRDNEEALKVGLLSGSVLLTSPANSLKKYTFPYRN